jgi:hypothetical protein
MVLIPLLVNPYFCAKSVTSQLERRQRTTDMGIARNRSDARQAKVERLERKAGFFDEGDEEGTEAAIDV